MSVAHTKTHTSAPILLSIFLGMNIATSLIVAVILTFLPGVDPYLFFIPTILWIAFYFGFKFGLLTTMISIGASISYLYYPSYKPLMIASTSYIVELIIFFCVGTGISYAIDLIKHQDKVSQYQKKLRQNAHVIETLEHNYQEAQKEIQARDQFLAIASHELKTPVTSMLLQVQTAIHNIKNVSLANFSVASLLKMLEGTEQQSKRLSRMVNDLLNLSLITTGKLDLQPEEVDLSSIVTDVAERFSERLKKEHTPLSVHAPKAVKGMWDKVRVEQAVVNLISNAVKYGNNKPIEITVSQSGHKAKLAVADQGIGISPDHQKRIFERFERAVSSRDYQGLGVGLYITNQIVKAHNGRISITSKQGKGTTFLVELPLN